MRPKSIELFEVTRKMHERITQLRVELEREIRTCGDIKELADYAYATQEAWKLIDECRKQVNAMHEQSEKLTCLMWAVSSENDGEPVRTPWCTASPRLKTVAAIPKRKDDPAGYRRLMDFFGVKPELWENDETEALRPHWPGMVEMLTRFHEQGKPLPPGIDPSKTNDDYSLTIRAKKGVDEA